MSKITLNPGSVFSKSQGNFIVSKDTIYAFTKSVSALNDSIYGMQPTRDQLLSGFSISDIFEVNPLSTNGSLCANVYLLDENIGAIKFFASRPFVVCKNEAERNELARNPLAIYLTPTQSQSADTSANSDSYEWIYVLSSIEGASDWDVVVSAYNEWKLSGDEFHLTSFPGKWELIGTTSFTDEKISGLVNDVYTYVNDISGDTEEKMLSLSNALSIELSALELSVSEISTAFDNFVETVETSASNLCSTISDEIERAKEEEQSIKDELSNYLPLSGEKRLYGDVSSDNAIIFNSIPDPSVPGIKTSTKINQSGVTVELDPKIVGVINPPNYTAQYAANQIAFNPTALTKVSLLYPSDAAKEIVSNYSETLATREWVGTRLSDVVLSVDQISTAFDDFLNTITDELSNEINPRLSTIANCVSSEIYRVDEISAKLSSYALKKDLKERIESELSDYNRYADGSAQVSSIREIIEWNAAIHNALSAIANL